MGAPDDASGALRRAALFHAAIRVCLTLSPTPHPPQFGYGFTDFWHFPGFDYTTLEAHDACVASGAMSQLLLWIGVLEVIGAIGIDQTLRGSGRAAGYFGARTGMRGTRVGGRVGGGAIWRRRRREGGCGA